jgi:hypothetical protein
MMNILLLVSVLTISTFAQNTTSQNAKSVRFFHGVASGPNVDVYLNSVSQGNLVASNLSPGSVSEYRNLTDQNAQSLNVIVTQTGSTSNIIANQTANLPANFKAATILIVPSNTSGAGNATGANATSANTTNIRLVVLNDQFNNGQAAPQGVGLIRFVNVANNGTNGTTAGSVTALSLQLANGTVLASNINYLDTNVAYIPLAPGTYNLQAVPANGGQPIANQQVSLAAGQALTLFAFIPATGAAALLSGTDTAVIFPPQVPAATATVTVAATSGAVTSGAATSGAVTTGAVTSGAVTSGAVTSGAQVTSGATQSSATTGVIITGFTTSTQRPVSAAGTLRCDVATLGVVCAILFTVFYRRD